MGESFTEAWVRLLAWKTESCGFKFDRERFTSFAMKPIENSALAKSFL